MKHFEQFLPILAMITILVGCQSTTNNPESQPITSDTEHSVLLDNNQRICDLAGTWDAIYKQIDGSNEDIIEITQTGVEFLGVKTLGSIFVPKGSETIRGTLSSSGFKVIQVKTGNGWKLPLSAKIYECNKIVIKVLSSARITLTRQ